MSFLHPWLLLGALGAAVPVLLHLFGRRRARRLPFSSLMLIQQAQRERSALMRVRQVLLMLLRALAVILLSLALAQPKLSWWQVRPDRAVLACDDSLSMRAKSPTWDVREAVTAAAAHLAPGRREVVWLGASDAEGAETELPEPGYAALDARERLGRLQEQHADDSGTVVYVLSDLQRSTWGGAARLPEAGPPTAIVDCGGEMRNASVLGLELLEPPALVGRQALAAVTVRSAQALPVRLLADGAEVAAGIAPGAPEAARIILEWTPRQAGVRKLTAVLPHDDLDGDNTGYAAVAVRERLRVLVLGTGLPGRLVAMALAPGADSRVQAQTVEALPQALDHDAVIVSSWPGQADVARLMQAVQDGLGLIVFTERLPERALESLWADGAPRLGPPAQGPFRVGDFDVFRAPLQAFANPAAGDLSAAEFRQARPMSLPQQQPWRVLARFDDGTAALAEGHLGRGRVLIANIVLDPKQTDLMRRPVFVPLMHRLVARVAREDDAVLPSAFVGQCVALPGRSPSDVTVQGPDGGELAWRVRDVRAHATSDEGACVVPAQPGFHTLRTLDGKRKWVFAANVDPAETDLTRVEAAALGRQLRLPVMAAQSVRRLGIPLALAAPLLLAALLLMLVEMALTHPVRRPRSSRGVP